MKKVKVTVDEVPLEKLEQYDPEDLLSWTWDNYGSRGAIFTSFQKTGCVMIDMTQKVAPELLILTIDTLR